MPLSGFIRFPTPPIAPYPYPTPPPGKPIWPSIAASTTDIQFGNSDFLLGGIGNDRLEGGEHRDLLIGHAGDDRLDGGAGPDLWIVSDDNMQWPQNTLLARISLAFALERLQDREPQPKARFQ